MCKASKLKISRLYKKQNPENLNSRKKFSIAEDDFIIKNYQSMQFREIAKHLNRSIPSINHRVSKLGLKKDKWTTDEKNLLIEKYSDCSNGDINKLFLGNKNPTLINAMARKLGLKKSTEKGLKWFNKNRLIDDFTELARKLGRTPTHADLSFYGFPSGKTYKRYFGSYYQFCTDVGLTPELGGGFDCVKPCISSNGDICDSNSEYIITEYLILNNIPYTKCVRYSDYMDYNECRTKTCDWVINGVFVEFFGMDKFSDYKVKMQEKIDLLNKNNIELIDLYKKDLNKLHIKLGRFIPHLSLTTKK